MCDLCDRDLFFPDHVAGMTRLLAEADFAQAFYLRITESGFSLAQRFDLNDPVRRREAAREGQGMWLSFFGHTLEADRAGDLHGTTTPDGRFTDEYFSNRFMRVPSIRTVTGWRPTVLSFHRGGLPGWSTERRRAELAPWAARMREPEQVERWRVEILRLVHEDRVRGARLLRRPLLIAGQPLSLATPRHPGSRWFFTLMKFMARRPGSWWFKPARRGWSTLEACRQK